jgi:hypothetical protein
MRRFRYICGGEDGRRDVGSLRTGSRGCAFIVGNRSFASCMIEAEYGGGSRSTLSATLFRLIFSEGAPLTI